MPEVGLHLHRDPITSRVVWHESQGHGSQGEARLYIADAGGHRVIEAALSVAPDGWPSARLLRVFGDGESGLEDSDATTARFAEPVACCRGGDLLWVADRGNHALRVIDLVDGRVGTAAGNGTAIGIGTGNGASVSRFRKKQAQGGLMRHGAENGDETWLANLGPECHSCALKQNLLECR